MKRNKNFFAFSLPVCLAILLPACLGEIDFFININADQLEEKIGSGGVIVISVSDDDAESSTLVSGELPLGLTLMSDGTIQGIPEETGFFEFEVETTFADGSSTFQTIALDVGD